MEEIKKEREISGQKSEQIYRSDVILLFIAVLFVALLVILFFSFKKQTRDKQKEYNNNSINQIYPNDSKSAGNQDGNPTQINGDQASGVEVTAVYEKDKSQNQIFFKLYFNTHAADYSNYDFQSNIVIRDLQNEESKAASVAKEGAGHHQSIEIAFPLAPSPFKLVVKNLADVPEREFNF